MSGHYLPATALKNKKRFLCGIALESLHRFPGGLVAKLPSPSPEGGQGYVEVGRSRMQSRKVGVSPPDVRAGEGEKLLVKPAAACSFLREWAAVGFFVCLFCWVFFLQPAHIFEKTRSSCLQQSFGLKLGCAGQMQLLCRPPEAPASLC